jgi:phytoene dehydrogenase-like protein
MKIIVIGSGLSGLTAGIYLAQGGHEVTILEQSPQPGGVTAAYVADGYRWDLGQLLIEGLGPDEPLGLILADLGIADQVKVIKDDRGYVFPDFELRKPVEYAGPRWRFERLKALFPGDGAGLERYWIDYLRFTRLLTWARRAENSVGFSRLSSQARMYLSLLPFLGKMSWSAQRLMDTYFQPIQLQCVFISILADFFTSPSQFPGLGVFALNAEAVYDRRIPKQLAKDAETLFHYSILGGMSTLVEALIRRIDACGGSIRTDSPVTKILVENNKAIGVIVGEDETLPADVVVASGGAKETFFELVGGDILPLDFTRKVRDLPLMDSVFMVHLGIDYDPAEYLHGVATYYYGSYDLDAAIDEAHEGIYHQGERGFVVHLPSRHSPSLAPSGCHAMTIYTICPDQLKEGDWDTLKGHFADRLVYFAEQYIPGLSSHVVTRHILTPEDFRKRTHLQHHAFGGIAPMVGAARVPHKTPIRDLWFVGAQSQSGGGVNNVIPGAYKTARLIHSKGS